MKKIKLSLLLYMVTALLTACGGSGQTSADTESSSGTAIQAAEEAPPIHDQISTIMRNEALWHKEDTRFEKNAETPYVIGPFYSLMDLDQDGYLEIVVTEEADGHLPSFYEVTAEDSLRKWTMTGDLPQAEGNMGIFSQTSKADCYYDASANQYHYIVKDKTLLSHDDADVAYLAMTPGSSGVSFRKIGRYTFDAAGDNTFHYFNADGKECQKSDITKPYSGMTKKTMYFSKTTFSDAGEIFGYNMEHSMWKQFILRDDYCPERELSDEFRHQFVALSICMREYVEELSPENETDQDTIRYTCTDLNNNEHVEIIIENTATKRYCIYECYDSEDEDRKWKTKGKTLDDFIGGAPSVSWQTCTLDDFSRMSYDLIEDNLREAWLRFTDTDWRNAYLARLKEIDEANKSSDPLYYFMKDIDRNGVPELFIITCEPHQMDIYTYKDHVQSIRTYCLTGNTRLLYSEDPAFPGVFTFQVGGGLEHYGYMTIQDDRFTETELWNEDYSGISKELGKERERIEELSSDKQLIEESRKVYEKNQDIDKNNFTTLLPDCRHPDPDRQKEN